MERAPLAPRPEYLPRPVPMPCPTRCLFCFCPWGGWRSLRFIWLILDDGQKVRNLGHHAAELRRIGALDHAIHFLQAEGSHDGLLFFRAADGTADHFDLDGCGCHG